MLARRGMPSMARRAFCELRRALQLAVESAMGSEFQPCRLCRREIWRQNRCDEGRFLLFWSACENIESARRGQARGLAPLPSGRRCSEGARALAAWWRSSLRRCAAWPRRPFSAQHGAARMLRPCAHLPSGMHECCHAKCFRVHGRRAARRRMRGQPPARPAPADRQAAA